MGTVASGSHEVGQAGPMRVIPPECQYEVLLRWVPLPA
jgi:hypothetical protein